MEGLLFLRSGRDIETIHGKNEIVFLDTKVHLKDGFLISEIYSKPKD